jgi:soluble lytic murein transglycosylase
LNRPPIFMRAFRAIFLVSAALGAVFATVKVANAQTAPASSDLPVGLVRQGGTVMMQPIPDSDEASGPLYLGGGERRVGLAHFLSAGDHDLYSRALEAGDHGDWTAARGLAAQGHDPIAPKLIQWRYLLDKNSGASFGEISSFLIDNPDWPERDVLFGRAEAAMDALMEPHAVLAWFGARTPVSGIGNVRLGEALIATGSITRGQELIRRAWIESSFDPQQEFAVIQRHGDILTPDVDGKRLEHLLFRNDTAGARRELSRVTAEAQRVAEARMALRSNPASGERLLDSLPGSERDDPGVLFDQAHLLRQRNNVDAIPSLLVRAPTREMAKISPTRWWAELNLDARQAIQQGSYHSAYALVADTGLPRDAAEYSEAEFLAGWIALRQLKEPRVALAHFQNLAQAVSRPISRARAHYWEGRANEAQGEIAGAWQQYRIAADNPETFYGQLALARLEAAPELHLTNASVDANDLRATYEREDLTRAIHVLADLGIESMLRNFAVHDADINPDSRHVKLLAEDLTNMGFREIAVRVAKEASYNGVQLLAYSHPVIAVPPYSGPGTAPEPAYVLGVIRQETEFDPDAVSGAGARGIMQVMPESARRSANLAGVEYRPGALTGDPTYSMQLGMTELAGDLADWTGSYVLAAAAYNAGPGNVRKWIATYGDPRNSSVDPVDWIEEIPFNETRNYVQRVIENMEVYRNRLAGRDQPLHVLADLYRPNSPQVGPLPHVPVSVLPASTPPLPAPRPVENGAAQVAVGVPATVPVAPPVQRATSAPALRPMELGAAQVAGVAPAPSPVAPVAAPARSMAPVESGTMLPVVSVHVTPKPKPAP